jgi:prepilin-type N-terminal cleavage/methylation domain-containing protein
MLNVECGALLERPRCAHESLVQHSAFPIQHSPRGLTLIELLVTIVILVTLLAAVLPAISPNNDSRKIREAARQLSSLFAQAQAQAARDGRAVGVGFRDRGTWNDANNDNFEDPGEVTYTGMALEAYIIAEPPPFTGFSTSSAVGVMEIDDGDIERYEDLSPNTPVIRNDDAPLVNLVFGHNIGSEPFTSDPSDWLPPRMFRGAELLDEDGDNVFEAEGAGDIVQIGQEQFELILNDCDEIEDQNDPHTDYDAEQINGEWFLNSQAVVTARWLTWRFRPLEVFSPGGKAYRIRRRPVASESPSRTGAQTLQFPRGVGVDFDPTDGDSSLGIVFSPSGTVETIFRDGEKEEADEPLFILLGRVENSNPPNIETPPGSGFYDIDYTRYAFDGSETDDELAQRRREVNLLNPDSRWVVVSPAGRTISSENASFDPRAPQFVEGPENNDAPGRQRERQRDAAREFAAQMETEGGG